MALSPTELSAIYSGLLMGSTTATGYYTGSEVEFARRIQAEQKKRKPEDVAFCEKAFRRMQQARSRGK